MSENHNFTGRVPRLLLVTTVPETFATILCKQPRYLSNSFEVALVTSDGCEFNKVVESEGLQTIAVPMARGISPLRDLVSIFKMVKALRCVSPDLVHSYTPKAGLIAMLSAWICRIPVRVHTFTGLIFPSSSGVRRFILVFVDKLICACATHVVPEGEGVKRDLQLFGITTRPLVVIGFGNIAGVDTKQFSRNALGVLDGSSKIREKLLIGRSEFIFVFVGRLNKDKGLRELVAAFSLMPDSVHLLLVGGHDSTAPVDAETLDKIRKSTRIHELGFLEDVRAAIGCGDVLVLPSYREGFPNVLLQAGAMEVPVIATDISGCNEIVDPGYNGWLVPARDVDKLADAMRLAMKVSESDLKKMGAQARSRVKDRFERESHWGRMREFYLGILNK